MTTTAISLPPGLVMPSNRTLYYGGAWHDAVDARWMSRTSPGTGESLGEVMIADAEDVDRAVAAARAGFAVWSQLRPVERADILRQAARVVRENLHDLALLDSADGGAPVAEMERDAASAAAGLEYFAGLVTEMKGSSVPLGDVINFSVREPYGVVGKIIPFNHPLMFCVYRSAAPLAAGNTVVIKTPEQAPLSALRFAELTQNIFPPGVFNVLSGGREAGAALAEHPGIDMVALIGSVPTGRAVMRAAADRIKPVLLELGGKNALIAYPDASPAKVAKAMVAGMNFTWCGQSCGSTSRAFVHESMYDEVVALAAAEAKRFVPGNPTDRATTMGAIISQAQLQKVLGFIESAREEGARLVAGGKRPADPALANGNYVEPTIFADVTPQMRVAREEIFGPVLSIFEWSDEQEMLSAVNGTEYGLTCSIWTNDITRAHVTARAVQAGYVWINGVSRHFPGTGFGGFKQSGLGREEGIGELLAYTQEKNVNIFLTGA